MLDIDFENKESLLRTFPSEQKCIEHLEALRWNGKIISPFDNTSVIYFCKTNSYKCRNSGKYQVWLHSRAKRPRLVRACC